MQDSRRWVGAADVPSEVFLWPPANLPRMKTSRLSGNDSQSVGDEIVPLLIPVGFADIAVELMCAGDPDPWYVTFGVAHTVDEGDIETIGLSVNTAWQSTFLPSQANTVTHTGCKITMGTADEPLRVFKPSNVLDNQGGSADNRLPQNCALLVRKNTNKGGRRNKGRFFVPLIVGETTVNSVGMIETSEVIYFQGLANAFQASLAEDADPVIPSTPMVVLHHSEGVSTAPSPTPVSSLQVDGVIATQRRRMR